MALRSRVSTLLRPRAGLVAPVVALFVFSLAFATHGRAEPSAIDPQVSRRVAAIQQASGPQVYAELRSLMDLWELVDPSEVEAGLEGAAASTSLSASARVYAKVLVAEARRHRGDTAGASEVMGELGFVTRWLFVGPFDSENKTGLARAYQPEVELSEPIVPGRVFDGKERPVRFRAAAGSTTFDFGDWVRPREDACGYASTFLTRKAGSSRQRATVWVGAQGAFKLWREDALVMSDELYRDLDVDRSAASIELGDGVTRLTIKVCSDSVSPRFALRLGDDAGNPIDDVEATSDSTAWSEQRTQAANAPAPKPGKPSAPAKSSVEGPVQTFARLTADKGAPAATLEAYARYLVVSGGDPKGLHEARDLAQRAIDKEPTVDRYLLAASLAEDRNQVRAWVDKAKALHLASIGEGAPSGKDADRHAIDILFAEARLARTSVNWRDAVPFYDAVLEKDPENLVAIVARVDLYAKAGLPRTSLATLEKAVALHPRSIAVQRTYALELRAVARDAEADEADARWFAFKADDTAYLSARLDEAIARRDAPSAEHWLARFVASEPDAVFAQATASRAYRALGKADEARRALESALEMAPDDASTLRTLADFAGEEGRKDEQLRLLKRILVLYPQAKDVQKYVEYLGPAKPRDDEQYAWTKEELLAAKVDPAKAGAREFPRRTLRNLTVTTVFPNGLASHFHQVAFQPLTDEAAAAARQYAFGYHGDKQEVEIRSARVYRADGSIAEAIESGEAAANDPSIAMYTSEREYYVQFPRLSPGDVVELRYRVDDVALSNDVADYFGEVEYMQSSEPIASAEYVVITPKTRDLVTWVGMAGVTKDVTEKGDQRIYSFKAKDVPALQPEPMMPPWSEVLGQVHVSTFASWSALGEFYWNLAKDQFDVDDVVRKKVAEITKGLTDDKSKVRAIYRYVTALRYVALEFGIEGIKPRRCALSLARGWGDCKDKATMIVTMLREAGIDSTIVIVRTGMRGDLPKDAPANMAAFDHAIAYVPSLDLYLDGTADGAGSEELPTMDRRSVALQINQGKPALVRLPDPGPEASPHTRKLDATVGSDGSADFTMDMTVSGADAVSWRMRYHPEGSRRDRATRDFTSIFGPFELGKGANALVVGGTDDVEKPVAISLKGKASTFARVEGAKLSVPIGPQLNLTSSLAALSSRTLPVVIGAQKVTTEERVIHIPSGMKVETTPTAQKVETPFGKVVVAVESAPGKVTITTTVTLSQARIEPSDYAAFRAFCESGDAAMGQRLVLAP
ncbi:MAG: DUF3857 domain-containing protein [Polyangiaceae bacterium]